MPPKAKAQWSTKRQEVVTASRADGSFHAEVPLYDGAEKVMTITLDITPDRGVVFFVKGEPGAQLTNFQGWSDI